jgi:hypothetical protein
MYRQLPVFGRLAYPVRVEATKHDRPGRKIPGCPAAVCAAVGTIWGEWMGPMNSGDHAMYLRNLRDSGYNPKNDFNPAGTIANQ